MNNILKLKQNVAFSLIEIMVVITITALLLTAIVPLYQENVRKASIAKAVSKLNAMQSTLTEGYLTGEGWPSELNSATAGVAIADTTLPFVTNFIYNNASNKAWYGYKLNADYGNGWVFMVLKYDAGVFQVHCGEFTAGCAANGSCDSKEYFPAGCNEEDLINI